jgi:hypothetical protein
VSWDAETSSLIRWPVVAWGLVRDHLDDERAARDSGRVHWNQGEAVALVVLTDCGGEWGQLGEAGGLIVPAHYSDADIKRIWGRDWLNLSEEVPA